MATLLGAVRDDGENGGRARKRPLGYAIVVGLAELQILTLYTTPLFYISTFDRLQAWANGLRKSGAKPAE